MFRFLIWASITLYLCLEIYLIMLIGSAVGAFGVVLLLFLSAILGIYMIRINGWQALNNAQQQLMNGQSPDKPLIDSAIHIISGILFLIPGFITDIVAILTLLPFTHGFMQRKIISNFQFQQFGFKRNYSNNNDDIYDAEYHEKRDDNLLK